MEDLDFDEPWLVVDMLLTAPFELPELNIQFCDPARPTTYVRGPGMLRRWEFMLLPGEEPSELVKSESIGAFAPLVDAGSGEDLAGRDLPLPRARGREVAAGECIPCRRRSASDPAFPRPRS